MKLSKLLTYTFDRNVGAPDRLFRIVSGALVATFPWMGVIALGQPLSILITVFGAAWLMTGVVSRCGLYYLLGMSTRPDA